MGAPRGRVFIVKTTASRVNRAGTNRLMRRVRQVAWAILLAPALGVWAQAPPGQVTGFQLADVNPETGVPRSIFFGGVSSNISNSELKISGGVRLVLFDQGHTNLIVSSTECLYNRRADMATSPGKLLAVTGDGRFSLEGQGFAWRKAGASLVISNQVHATVRKDLIASQSKTGNVAAAAGVLTSSLTNASAIQYIQIFSDRFLYQSNSATFLDHVRVEDAETKVTCGVLTVQFAEPSRRVDQIVAEQDVAIDAGEIHATGGKLIYRLSDNSLTLTEKPAWRLGRQTGSAEEIFLNHETREFRATRNVHLQMPSGEMSQVLFLPGRTASTTNAEPGRPVDVFADDFEFKPDAAVTNANVAMLRGNVRLNNPDGGERLSCRLMTVNFAAPESRTEGVGSRQKVTGVVAERDVVVERGEDRVTADKAVYAADAGAVEMTGRPAWRVEQGSGSAATLVFDLKSRGYRASGDVRMQMPPGSFGGKVWLSPGSVGRPNRTPAKADISTNAAVSPIQITSDEFQFASAGTNQTSDVATYRGHVRVEDPDRMSLGCETLTATLLAGKNQIQEILADRNVEITVTEPGSFRQAKGDRAVYRSDREELELTADNGVEIVVIETSGVSRARGERVVYDVARNVMRLINSARLTAPLGEAEGDLVVLDQNDATLRVTGNWKVKVPLATLKKTPVPVTKTNTAPAIVPRAK